MPLNRKQLLDKLENVAPALAEHDLIPLLQHVLFTGEAVLAYNDRIAISVPLRTNFKGSFPGKMLIDCLRIGAHTEEVILRGANGRAEVVAEQAEVNCESQTVEHYSGIFTMPKASREAGELNEKFFAAIDDCMQSVNEHSVIPDQLGVTIIPGRPAKLFSTTGVALTHAKVTLPPEVGLKERVVLPSAFCEQMLRLQKQAKKCKLSLRKDHALFSADNTLLFGKYIRVPRPLDFEGTLRRHMPNGKLDPVKPSNEQRPRLKIALEYAARVCDIKGNEVRTKVKVINRQMELSSVSNRARAIDTILLKHPNVEVQLQASLLKDVYDRYEDILITEQCAIMTRDNQNSMFMVASFQR